MNRTKTILILAALVGILFLYACSLNGEDPGVTVVTHGTMRKGSVIVNGVHFTVPAGTPITVDDSSDQPESELEDGMVVTLRGTVNSDGVTGTAEKVESEDELQGQVESVFPAADPAYLVVLSQNVYVDDLTYYGNIGDLSGLVDGDYVEVHGQRDANGNIWATRVEKLSGSPEIELKGVVSN